MKKKVFLLLAFLGAMLLVPPGFVGNSSAGVNVNIGIGLPVAPAVVYPAPPPVVVEAPPEMEVIPGTYVYYAPGVNVDLFFYHGFWWRPYEGRWYRSRGYRGPWAFIPVRRVPRPVFALPPGWRERPGYERVPYGEFRGNWRRWERERHWDRDEDHDRGWHGMHGRGRRGDDD